MGLLLLPADRTLESGEGRHQDDDLTRLISVVIPAFNEAEGIERCIAETVAAMTELGDPFELVVIDDGSSDATSEVARQAAERHGNVRVLDGRVNLGKGSALIRGAHAAAGALTLFMDADLEVHPRQVRVLIETLEREQADVVIGSKLHPDSQIEYPRRRRILSYGYYLLVRLLFRLPVHDTQTGLKLYRRSVLVRVAPRLLVKRFAHDLETLVNVHRLGYRIVEAPVVVTRERPYPRVGLRDAWHVFLDTLAIAYRMYVLHYYDRVGAQIDVLLADQTGRFPGIHAAAARRQNGQQEEELAS